MEHFIVNFFSEFSFWHWWIISAVLLLLELFTATTLFLWLAVSSGLVGLISWAFPTLSLEMEGIIFAILCILSGMITRQVMRGRKNESYQPNLNARGSAYVGQTYTLASPIINGRGKLKINDTLWTIKGPDTPAGVEVTVTEMRGLDLVVEIVE